MASSRQVLRGRRGWLAVASLTLALGTILGSQAVSASAGDTLSPVAATTPLSPSVASESVTADAEGPAAPVTTDAGDAAAATTPAPAVPAPKPTKPTKAAKPAAAPRANADVCSGPGWQAKRGQAAMATLRDNGQRSGVSVAFKGAKSGYLGLTFPERRHVDVYVRSCSAESFTLLRHVMSHEMGHAYDAAHMSAADRKAYMAMRGIPAGTPWFGCNYCTDFNTPAGDFAETYSQWQRGSRDSRTQIAPMPGPAELEKIAASFFGA
jgi:hypothetical protein